MLIGGYLKNLLSQPQRQKPRAYILLCSKNENIYQTKNILAYIHNILTVVSLDTSQF